MKLIHKIKYPVAFLLMVLCWMLCPAWIVQASETENPKGSITVECGKGENQFCLYLVGIIDDDGNYALNKEYEKYPVILSNSSAVQTLEAYIMKDKHQPIATQKPDSTNHLVQFENLEEGIYLISAKPFVKDNVIYKVSPSFVVLPSENDMNVTIKMKSKEEIPPETKNITVLKVWEQDDPDTRPKEIYVDLLKNGEIYETAFLTADSDWRYQWTGLDGSEDWKIAESQVPAGYTVSVTAKEKDFVIVNTGKQTEPPQKITSPSPVSSPVYASNNPIPDTTPKVSNSLLPQTGQLKFPAVIMISTGMILISVGMIRRNHHD